MLAWVEALSSRINFSLLTFCNFEAHVKDGFDHPAHQIKVPTHLLSLRQRDNSIAAKIQGTLQLRDNPSPLSAPPSLANKSLQNSCTLSPILVLLTTVFAPSSCAAKHLKPLFVPGFLPQASLLPSAAHPKPPNVLHLSVPVPLASIIPQWSGHHRLMLPWRQPR